jgi:hypothetical protein
MKITPANAQNISNATMLPSHHIIAQYAPNEYLPILFPASFERVIVKKKYQFRGCVTPEKISNVNHLLDGSCAVPSDFLLHFKMTAC